MGKQYVVMKDLGGYLRPDQIERLLNVAVKEREWLLIFLLFNTGRRISELLKLKPKDIDSIDNTITWTILKKRTPTKKRIAIHQTIIDTLHAYIYDKGISEDGYVFESNRKPSFSLTRYWADKVIKKLGIKAGLEIIGSKKIHCHVLRHSYCIRLLKGSKRPGTIKIVQDQLAHSSIKVTSEYMQFSQEDHHDVLNDVYNS